MQSSLVHVPCKSGSPHGVFDGLQFLAPGAALAGCAIADSAASAKMAARTTTGLMDTASRCLIRLSFQDQTGLVSRNSDSSHNSRAGHPGWLRCSSLTYSRYARSSRLAIRAPRSGTYATNHCYGTLGTAACYILYVAVPRQNAIEAISSGFSKY